MDMKEHILAALREQFQTWEEMLAGIPNEEITIPLLPSPWSIKDIMVHLWAWQQRTSARVEAARSNHEPEFPKWVPGLDPAGDENTDQTNAWIYETYKELPWAEVHQNWREGFQHLLEASASVPEKDLLDSGKYKWQVGYALAAFLLSTYDHHQEHLENLIAWRKEHEVA
jgi:hypothetical protein